MITHLRPPFHVRRICRRIRSSLTLSSAVTMAAVRRELAEEEAIQHRTQNAPAVSAAPVRMSAGVMVAAGIELEEQQYVDSGHRGCM